jgi:hypothetical protein
MDGQKYVAIYFPEDLLEAKDNAYDALLDIEANYSKLIQELLPDITYIGRQIKNAGKTTFDYTFQLVAVNNNNPKDKIFLEIGETDETT